MLTSSCVFQYGSHNWGRGVEAIGFTEGCPKGTAVDEALVQKGLEIFLDTAGKRWWEFCCMALGPVTRSSYSV